MVGCVCSSIMKNTFKYLSGVLSSIYLSILALQKQYVLSHCEKNHTRELFIQVRFFYIYRLIVYVVLMKFYSRVSNKNYVWDRLKKKSEKIVLMDAKDQKVGYISMHRISQTFLQNPTLCTDFIEVLHEVRSLKFSHHHS